jgi:hypothetical protein
MNYCIEILRIKGSQPPHVLHKLMHCAPSFRIMRDTLKVAQKSPYWPLEGNSYRVLSHKGTELYRWHAHKEAAAR